MIRFNDRVLILGATGKGKSEVLNHIFTALDGGAQRVLLDTKHEFAIPDVEPVSDVEAIDWTQPIVHYRDRGGGAAEMNELFGAVHARRRVVVAAHELSDVCEFNAGRTPPKFDAYVSKGRALGQGLLAGSQRPVEIPSRARSEADHVFVMAPGFALPQDQKAVAQTIGRPAQELQPMLIAIEEQLGPFSFLHYDRREGTLEACAPLTDGERAGIAVHRPMLY